MEVLNSCYLVAAVGFLFLGSIVSDVINVTMDADNVTTTTTVQAINISSNNSSSPEVDLLEANVTMINANNATTTTTKMTTMTMRQEVGNATIMTAMATESGGKMVICRIDAAIDFQVNPDNIYKCPADQVCCVEGGRPSCCVDKNMDEEIRDQAILWGGVLGAVIFIGVILCCCCRDFDFCEGDENCGYYAKCGCCRKKESDEYRKLPPALSNVSIATAKSSASSAVDPALLSVEDLQATQAQRLSDALMAD